MLIIYVVTQVITATTSKAHLFFGRGKRAVDAGAQTVDEPRVESLGRSDHAALGMTTEVNVYPWLQGGAPPVMFVGKI